MQKIVQIPNPAKYLIAMDTSKDLDAPSADNFIVNDVENLIIHITRRSNALLLLV
jgi:hypothetical protein